MSDPFTIGDGPVQAQFAAAMRHIASAIDDTFNGPPSPTRERKTGFVLLVFEFGDPRRGHRCNYMSNAQRADVIQLLKDQLKHFESDPV